MQYTTSIVLSVLATLAVAAPPANRTVPLEARSFQGSINWFTRYDCQNPCVEIGMCLMGQTEQGMAPDSDNDWIGWDSGCWDRPDGANSVALSVSNGHHFKALTVSCKEYVDGDYQAPTWGLASGESYGVHKCNHMYHKHIKAVMYHW